MAQIVKLRRSSVSGQKPTNSNLQLGELALNTTDGKVYMAKSGSLGPSVEELVTTNTVNTGSLSITGAITGSVFTGSFIGDGSGLYNLPIQNINTASLATTGSNIFVGNQTITGSINITGTVDGVDISDFSSSVNTRLNSVTASGGISAIYIADEGSIQGTASYFDFIGAGISAAVNNGTASITVTATGGGGSAVQGASQTYTQTTNATTWSIDHSINSRTPVVEIYDQNYNVIIPTGIYNPGAFQTLVYFDVEQRGFAIISTGGGLTVDGANAILDQASASSTWTFNHNLGTKYPVFNIFDSNDDVIIPQRINVVDENSAVIYFSSARSGKAVASVGGDVVNSDSSSFSVSSSFATNANFLDGKDSTEFAITGSNIFKGNQVITGSLNLSGSVNITGSVIINQLTYPTPDFPDGQYGVEVPTLGVDNVFSLEIPRTIYEYVKNDSGVTLYKGTPVHSVGTTGFNTLIIAASASLASTMPATFILAQDLDAEEEGLGIAIGSIQGVDTTGLTAGDPVYVGVNGGWTQTKPTGSNLIQNLGIVTKVGVNGGGVVLGAGRSNDIPNIQPGHFWIGNNDWIPTATSTSSFAKTGSNVFNGNQTINGSLTITGDLTAQQYIISSSILHLTQSFSSGSTIFGDTPDDAHQFTGSVLIDGGLSADSITGSIDFNNITNLPSLVSGSSQIDITGTTGYSTFSSSIATTDYNQEQRLGSLETESGSIRSNFNSFTSSYNTGSFSGSFIGDGSQLFNIPASGVTGLQLDKIADGAATASISQTNGFVVNTNTIITGSLTATALSGSLDFDYLINIPTLVSGSEQLTGSYDTRYVLSGSITQTTWDNIANKPSGLVSGSEQLTGSYDTRYVLSGSITQTTWDNIANKPNDIVSSSSQISAFGFATTGSFLTTGSNSLVGNQNINGNLSVTGSVVISGSLDLSNANVGNSRYLHTQGSSSTTWNIVHNLNYLYPNITVYDGDNKIMLPDEVTSIDLNTTQVTFAIAESGHALASVGGISPNAADRYLHTQTSATGSWVIDHNIGYKYVTVNVYDNNDEQLVPLKISAVSANRTQIDFSLPTSGNATITVGGPRVTTTSLFNQTGSYYNATTNIGITGSLVVTGDVDADNFNTTSDRKLKTNLVRIEGALDKIEKLNGYTFDWLEEYSEDRSRQIGMVADEVYEVQPELISHRNIVLSNKEEKIKLLDYSKVTAILIEAIKELNDKVTKLENKKKKK